MDWSPFNTAPRDGTAIQAEIPGNGSDNIIAWDPRAFYDSNGRECGGWHFVENQEPPSCWTDGVCWAKNEDGVPSVQPTRWRVLPIAGPAGKHHARP